MAAPKWRGSPNRAPRRDSRPGRRPAGSRIEGVVRWTEPGRIHVEVEDRDGVRDPLEGEVVALDLSGARVRLQISDRDGDGRIDTADIVLGDRVEAEVGNLESVDPKAPIVAARRLLVRRD